MNLLTCLGTGNYKETRYQLGGEEVVTRQFGLAAARFVSAAKVYVALTAKAEDHPNWWELQTSLTEAGHEAFPVRIPDGGDEQEIWQVFSVIADAVGQEEELALDITHGFRTLPMMAMVLAAYLQASGGARIRRVLYGAFEARNEETNVTPVFDLTSFLALYEWANALALFRISGDSRGIADLLKRYDRTADRAILPREYREVSRPLKHLSGSLALARPSEVAKHAAQAVQFLRSLPPGDASTEPFTRVVSTIADTYAPLQQDDKEGGLRLIEWYLNRRRYFQAVPLAREWLVNRAGERLYDSDDWINDPDKRYGAETALNNVTRSPGAGSGSAVDDDNAPTTSSSQPDYRLAGPSHESLRHAWEVIRDVRNDLMHCGYRKGQMSSNAIEKWAHKLPGLLRQVLQEGAESGDST